MTRALAALSVTLVTLKDEVTCRVLVAAVVGDVAVERSQGQQRFGDVVPLGKTLLECRVQRSDRRVRACAQPTPSASQFHHTAHQTWVRYFGNLSDIDDRVRNISWQTLNLTQNLTLTLILTLTLNPNHMHTYIYTAIYVRRVAEIVYARHGTGSRFVTQRPS